MEYRIEYHDDEKERTMTHQHKVSHQITLSQLLHLAFMSGRKSISGDTSLNDDDLSAWMRFDPATHRGYDCLVEKLRQPDDVTFWEPIGQCPKRMGVRYDLLCEADGCRIRVLNTTFANNRWYKTDIPDDWGKPDMLPLLSYYGKKYGVRLTVIAFAKILDCASFS